jgi:hypothetical protein
VRTLLAAQADRLTEVARAWRDRRDRVADALAAVDHQLSG